MARSSVPASAGQILQMIRSGQVSTRRELQELTGLSRSTLTLRLSQLYAAGYLRSEGQRAGTMGRPSGILAFDETGKFILAADLGATHARMALTDAAGNVIAETTRGLHIDDGPRSVLGVVQKTFRAMVKKTARDLGDVCGIGIGVPGPVDFESGRVRNPPMMPGWHDHPIREGLAEAFGTPVFVDNDANLMGLGEQRLTYPDVASLLFVKVGTGIGSGIILHGRPFPRVIRSSPANYAGRRADARARLKLLLSTVVEAGGFGAITPASWGPPSCVMLTCSSRITTGMGRVWEAGLPSGR
jgi:DNA-binding transcriptional ArsR family regulator